MTKKARPLSAFPTNATISNEQFPGMLLRDYFAAHASEEDIAQYIVYGEIGRGGVSREMARFRYADVMLEARK